MIDELDGVRAGAFVLEGQLGAGAGGTVWRARHAELGRVVAIKVIASRLARELRQLQKFRDEARAVAGLYHPGIIAVLDFGFVEVPNGSDAQVRDGSPFLAMELAGGTLEQLPVHNWDRVRRSLLQVLDALAHAHARGVIHRDLKPQNVLVGAGETGSQLKISDFGLSYPLGDAPIDDPNIIYGTPMFMAPEQITGEYRDHGPWTDLYSVGCLASWMVTGRPPFTGSVTAVLDAHLHARIPVARPRFAVPDGFHDWLAKLLRKDPRERFRFAADAAHALVAMGEASARPRGKQRPSVPTSSGPTLEVGLLSTMPIERVEAEVAPEKAPATGARVFVRTSPPPTWRRREKPPPTMDLIGTGLGLYGLRRVPLVDREVERAEIWRALHEVYRTRRARAVILRGASGTGKSCTAEWMCQRASELGLGYVLAVRHSPTPGDRDGLPAMIGRYFRCASLTRDESARRIRRADPHISAFDAAVLAELAAAWRPRTPSPAVRRDDVVAVTARLIGRIAFDRPVILYVDDLQWGPTALALIETLIGERELPVLVIATVRENSVAAREDVRARIAALADTEAVVDLQVTPLPEAEHLELVEQLLRLAPELARRVAEHTCDSPLFAVQLVGDWVQRGVLKVTPEGFSLAESTAAADLPADLFAVWSSRFDEFVAGWPDPPSVRRALFIAACLGLHVDHHEWAGACEAAQLAVPETLAESWITAGLGERRVNGWSFCHGSLRDAVEELARNHGDRELAHAACGRSLLALDEAGARRSLARVAFHQIEAGALESALDTLLAAAERATRESSPARAIELLSQREALIDRLELGDDAGERAVNDIAVAEHLHRQGSDAAAARRLERGEAIAEALGLDEQRFRVARLRGRMARRAGRLDEALAQATRALAIAGERDHPLALASAHRDLAAAHAARGDIDRAIASLQRSRSLYEDRDDRLFLGQTLATTAALEKSRGDPAAALEYIDEAIAVFQGIGAACRDVASALAVRSEIDRAAGDLDAAEANLTWALQLERPGSRELAGYHAQLALVAIDRERLADARAHAERARLAGDDPRLAAIDLVCEAAESRWGRWDLAAAELEAAKNLDGDRDVARCARRAAELCRQAGDAARASRAEALANAAAGRISDDRP